VKQSTTTPYHAMGNGITENFNKTIKNLPTEQNKLSLAWHGPYKVVGTVGEVD